MAKQRTIKESFALSGKGLHTGLNLTVEFCPAPENFTRPGGQQGDKDQLQV